MEKRIFDNIINFLLSYEQNEITFEWTTWETGVEHIDWEYGSNDLGRKKIVPKTKQKQTNTPSFRHR